MLLQACAAWTKNKDDFLVKVIHRGMLWCKVCLALPHATLNGFLQPPSVAVQGKGWLHQVLTNTCKQTAASSACTVHACTLHFMWQISSGALSSWSLLGMLH
jgi:hypothetical protein